MVMLLSLMLAAGCFSFTGSAEVVEDASMVDLQESGGQVVLAGGTVVTLVNKANKCIRKAMAGDNLSVHYTGRLGGPGGKVFDTSRKGGEYEDEGGDADADNHKAGRSHRCRSSFSWEQTG